MLLITYRSVPRKPAPLTFTSKGVMRLKRKLRQLRDFFDELKWSVVDGLVCAGRSRIHTESALFIRMDGIGDFVLGYDAVQTIVRHYKNQGKRVVLAGRKEFAALAKDLSIFDEVIAVDRNKFRTNIFYRFRMATKLRRGAFGTAISLTYPRDFSCSDSIIRTCGAAERIGFDGNLSQIPVPRKTKSDRWYTRQISPAAEIQTFLDRNAELVRKLLGVDYRGKIADLRSWGLALTHPAVLSDLAENERYYVIFPGAGYVARQWSPERFGALANLIYARTGWRGVICGASSDKRIAQVIVSDSPSPLVDWTGRTTLGELASVLIRSQLLVTNDTSAVHIAAAVGTPSICVLGGGQFGQFLPYAVDAASQTTLPRVAYHPMDCFGCNWQCKFPVGKYRPKPCVERVEVDQVLDQVKIILNRSPAKQEARFPLLKAISP